MSAPRLAAPRRVPFYGRVDDGSDPATAVRSLARRYQQCLTLLPDGAATATLYDIGSRHHPRHALANLGLGHRHMGRVADFDIVTHVIAEGGSR